MQRKSADQKGEKSKAECNAHERDFARGV
jgi:hypothetical protein